MMHNLPCKRVKARQKINRFANASSNDREMQPDAGRGRGVAIASHRVLGTNVDCMHA